MRRMLVLVACIVAASGARAVPLPPGTPDPAFGAGGIVAPVTGFGAAAVLPEADGGVLVAGTAYPPAGSPAMAGLRRYRNDGTLDAAFGAGGIVTSPLPVDAGVVAAARAPDRSIVVLALGHSLLRYLPDGTLDGSFGRGGIVTTLVPGGFVARDVLVRSDGRVLVLGTYPAADGSAGRIAAVVYARDGSLDTGFDPTGLIAVPPSVLAGLPRRALVDAQDRLVIATASRVARLSSSGAVDATFGDAGTTDVPFAVSDVATLPGGGLAIAGVDATLERIALARLTAAGAFDTSFGGDGIVSTALVAMPYSVCSHNPPSSNPGGAVVGLPDGSLVVAAAYPRAVGGATICARIEWTTALARHLADGSLDAAFGRAGVAIGTLGLPQVPTASLDARGRLVFAAFNEGFGVARYLVDSPGTTVTVTSDRTPSAAGDAVAFTAMLAGRSPTGTVTFANANRTIAACADVPVAGGRARCVTSSFLAMPGDNPITASYPGDEANPPALSQGYAQAVTAPASGAAIEFHNATLDDYVLTSQPAEIASLDASAASGWHRTGQFFLVDGAGDAGAVTMCRFTSGASFAPLQSHFYTPFAAECSALESGTVWQFEGDVLPVRLASAEGACAAGTVPLFRLFRGGPVPQPNHRFTVDVALVRGLYAQGWTLEGNGPDTIFACARDGPPAVAAR